MSGVVTTLSDAYVDAIVDRLLQLPEPVRKKVEGALFWIREPRQDMRLGYKSDVLRVYAAYWNAFECLVDAVNKLQPGKKQSKSEKQKFLDEYVSKKGGKLSPDDIQKCYKQVVNPGLPAQAEQALSTCFGADAKWYMDECFKLADERNRLYNIRNAINHGEIDAENPAELLRVEARLSKLWTIVWRMFAMLTPFPAPADEV